MPGNENQVVIDDAYVDPIALKKISEMTQPIVSPHTGHVYDKVDLLQWINTKGTDPIDKDKPLTAAMLVSGFVMKKVASETDALSKKVDAIQAKLDKFTSLLEKTLEQNETLIKENAQLKKDNAKLQQQAGKAIWHDFGSNVDKKIKWGSSAEREAALKAYKENVINAKDETQLKTAVTDPTIKNKYSERRFFKFLGGEGDTSKAVSEFQSQATKSKGW